MDKEDIFRIVNDGNNISGIYNYCDRWCERCRFTSKCALFYASQKSFSKNNLMFDPAGFFEELNSIFQTTRELLQDKIDELFPEGIPEEIIKEEEERQKSIEEKINNSRIVNESKKYSQLVSIWIEKNKEFINQYRTSLDIKETEKNQYDSMNTLIPEAIEVILFYQYFIEIKIRRALFDKFEEEANDSIDDEDMLTSAKLILLSITRSIASWEILYERLKQPDDVLETLIHLERVRRNVKKIFPNAWEFKRPYFD